MSASMTPRRGYSHWATMASLSFGAALIAACSSATGPASPQRYLAGTWTTAAIAPGSSEEWTLAVSGTVVSGSGIWFGEACCNGTVTVTGAIAGDSLHLDLHYNETSPAPSANYFTIHVDGVLDTPTDLVGIARHQDSTTNSVHYVRKTN